MPNPKPAVEAICRIASQPALANLEFCRAFHCRGYRYHGDMCNPNQLEVYNIGLACTPTGDGDYVCWN
ncbi:hypothetical protein WAI453_007908 [Rhynchosporium graminicola]